MKYIKSYKLFESLDSLKETPIEEFVKEIELNKVTNIQPIIDWWNKNRSHIKIYHFSFNSNEPIMGGIIDYNSICINKKVPIPPQIKLFITLHESKHIDQHNEGRFEDGYFNTVLNDDKESFLTSYKELEKEANDYAFSSMRELGLDQFVFMQERMLRGNENSGNMVYEMMKRDIDKLKVTNFYDLLKKQIL